MADVIAAISTAMQKGGIAVIRISGYDAFNIADKVFSGQTKIEDSESHRILYGHVYDEDLLVDECLCSVMKGPRSFTAENVVEISVHGGIIPAKRTLEAVIKAGIPTNTKKQDKGLTYCFETSSAGVNLIK